MLRTAFRAFTRFRIIILLIITIIGFLQLYNDIANAEGIMGKFWMILDKIKTLLPGIALGLCIGLSSFGLAYSAYAKLDVDRNGIFPMMATATTVRA
jgi:hypothetical protein